MTHSAKSLASSISPDGVRLMTFELTYPRIIHAEMMTHRMFSRNAGSSRAIPVRKMIQAVQEDPYIPSSWGKNQRGMQAGEDLVGRDAHLSELEWLLARDHAITRAKALLDIGVHKQLTNRLLEPFLWYTAIFTATELDNFFHLRCHPDAHPDIRKIAELMRDLYNSSEPTRLDYGQWHLPLIQAIDREAFCDADPAALPLCDLPKVSVARCARVSYLTHDGKRDIQADIDLHDRLLASGHMSPFEHVARPLDASDFGDDTLPLLVPHRLVRDPHPIALHRETFCGNFRGWVSYRKTIPHESDILAPRGQRTQDS